MTYRRLVITLVRIPSKRYRLSSAAAPKLPSQSSKVVEVVVQIGPLGRARTLVGNHGTGGHRPQAIVQRRLLFTLHVGGPIFTVGNTIFETWLEL